MGIVYNYFQLKNGGKMLQLKAANLEDIEKEWQFIRNVPADENGFTNDWSGISREDFEQTALPDMIRFSKGENLPDWMVPETFYFLWNDDAIVGEFRLRHYLNDALRNGAGHIGQFIAKEFRGKGFGTAGLKLVLDEARKIIPEDEIYLRLNRGNEASLKVMLKNGGHVVKEDAEKLYVRIKKLTD